MDAKFSQDLLQLCHELQHETAFQLGVVGAIRLAHLCRGDLTETLLYRAAKELRRVSLELPDPDAEAKFLSTYLRVALYHWLHEKAQGDMEVRQLADAWANFNSRRHS